MYPVKDHLKSIIIRSSPLLYQYRTSFLISSIVSLEISLYFLGFVCCYDAVIIIMNRSKQKPEDKKSAQNEGLLVDKKINDLCSQIRESRNKLDAYVGVISSQVGQIVNHRLNKFVALHSEIVQQKDHEIKALEEHNQKVKLSQAGENIERLMKTIANYETEIERVNTIKEMFRKESERFKIELDIKEKELDASKKREKQLMKQIWVLEEDIKDIYSAEPASFHPAVTSHNYNTPPRNKNQSNLHHKLVHLSNRIVSTQPTEIESRQRFQSRLQDKYSGYKAGLHLGITRLRQKFSISSQQKRMSSGLKSNTPSIHASNVKYSIVRPVSFSQARQVDIYQDLRTSLRKASKINETQSQSWNQGERMLKVEDFRIICLYGPKIMKQIEGVVIQKFGELKEVDQASIQLLKCLFKNENAIKILEIVLFNYSLEAIEHIHDHKRQLTTQIAYNQPSLDSQQSITTLPKPKKIKMQKQLRKKFKNSFMYKASDQYSHRAKKE